MFHTRYFFLKQYKRKFIIGRHHEIIVEALERVLSGKCLRLIIQVAPRFGKAIDSNTPMLTDLGWISASDVQVGDSLIGSDGKFTKVTGVYPQGILPAYHVSFSNSKGIVTCGEHLWEVQNRDRLKPDIKRTSELIGDLRCTPEGNVKLRRKWRIPVVKPLELPKKELPIDPYLFGCWLGDGSTYKAEICTMDESVIEGFSDYGYTVRKHQSAGKATEYGILGGFITKLKALGVIRLKFIPDQYLLSSFDDRLALLQGLCDTDGTANRDNNAISIAVTNKRLELGIRKLISSLGGIYTLYHRKNNNSVNINFRIPDTQPFRLQRKLQHCLEINNRSKPRRFIDAIEPVEPREMVCFSVDAQDKLFAAGYDLVLTHNTELAVKSFISHGLALNPSAKFIHLSYSDDLALDNSETIKDLVNSEDYQTLFPAVKIKQGTTAKNKWYTTEGGGVLARAAGGSVTGFGAGKVDEEINDGEIENFLEGIDLKQKFNGAIVIDDPIKVDEADSETIRERVNQRFDSTIRTRTNSRKTPIIVIMQRTHPNDLAGYLQRKNESDKWEVISLPVINDDGTALWPHKMTVQEAINLKEANDLVFERQYMQNPKPKAGLLFPIEDLKFYNPKEINLNDPDFKYLPADPAGDGGDSFAAMETNLIGDRIYVPQVLFNTDGTDHNEEAVVKMIIDGKIMYSGIEGVFGWADSVIKIRAELERKGYEGEVRLLRPRTGKHARITTRAAFIRNHFYFREDYDDFPQYAKFIRNLTSYLRIQEPGRMNKHDDAPDVSEMAASYYQKEMGHLWPM